MNISNRNLIIFGGLFFIACLFIGTIGVIGAGALGFMFTTESTVTIEPTDESIVNIPEPVTPLPEATHTDEPQTASASEPTLTPQALEPEETPQSTQVTPLPEISADIAAQMDQIEAEVITLRNLQPAGSVSRALLTRDQLRQNIEDEFFEDYSPEEAEDDGQAPAVSDGDELVK